MKDLLIAFVLLMATSLLVTAQTRTAKAPTKKLTTQPAKKPMAQPSANNNRTALPNKTPAETAPSSASGGGGNGTKLPAGSSTVAPARPNTYTSLTKLEAPARSSSSSYRAPSRRSAGEYAFGKGTNLLNGGLGFGYKDYYNSRAFPVGVSYEYGITPDISIGAQFDYATVTYEYDIYTYGFLFTYINTYRGTYTTTYFGGRGSYHFNRLFNLNSDKLDLYAGVGLGYRGYSNEYSRAHSPLSLNGFVGSRFFFTDSFGGFVELGYTGLSLSKIGLSFKF